MIYDIKYFSTITFIMSLTLSLARMWVGHQHFWDWYYILELAHHDSVFFFLFFFYILLGAICWSWLWVFWAWLGVFGLNSRCDLGFIVPQGLNLWPVGLDFTLFNFWFDHRFEWLFELLLDVALFRISWSFGTFVVGVDLELTGS